MMDSPPGPIAGGAGAKERIIGSPHVPYAWKVRAARWMRSPLLNVLLRGAIRLAVPKRRIGVTLVIFDEADRVLLLRHVFHPYVPWGLPGGWLGRREPPSEGALRELREETGLRAQLGPVVHVAADTQPPHVTIAYLAWLEEGPMILSPEIIEAGWYPPDGMPPLFASMEASVAAAVALRQQWGGSRPAAIAGRAASQAKDGEPT